VLGEKGVPGLVLYILVFIMIAFYGIKILRKETDKDISIYIALIISGILGYMAFAFFDFPLERINHQVYLMMMMASVISIYYRHYPSKSFKNLNKQVVKIHIPAIVLVAASIYYAGVLLKMEFNVHQIFAYRNAQNLKKVIELADQAFTKLTPIDAFSSPIHLHSGEAELQLKNYNQAMADLTTALDYSPNHISILNDLAIVSAEMHDTKKAIGYLDKCLSIYPKYEPSLYNKVNVYYRNKEYANAYVSLLNCNTMNPRADYKEFMKVMTERVNH
jgi:tetratricopeptide (TPR) repeat protein